jgi:hypothetical protein
MSMKVELILNPQAAGYDQFQRELREELRALKKTSYKESSEPAPPKVLTVEHDVVKFAFEHPSESLGLAKALVELVRAVIERLGIKAKKGEPPAVLLAKKKSLPLPSTQGKERRFLDWIRRGAPEKPAKRKKLSRKKKSRN